MLERNGRKQGSTYLIGYASEIALKLSVAKLAGLRATDDWDIFRATQRRRPIDPAVAEAVARAGGHDHVAWLRANQAMRRAAGLPLADSILDRACRALASHWSPELRYKGAHRRRSQVREAASLIVANRTSLWR